MNCWVAMPACTRPWPSVPGTWNVPERSRPEQNPRPAPVSTTTLVERSSRRSSSTPCRSCTSSWFMALRRSGRFSVRTVTPGRGVLSSMVGMAACLLARVTRATLAPVTDQPNVRDRYDVVVVGGGHNALVAAAYLGRAGLSVCVLERAGHVGGAAVSGRVFPGVDARLSRYSYLVSLLPDRIVADLGLDVRLASRPVASFTPVRRGAADLGLLVEREPGPATAESFRALTGSDDEYAAWRAFYADAEQRGPRRRPHAARTAGARRRDAPAHRGRPVGAARRPPPRRGDRVVVPGRHRARGGADRRPDRHVRRRPTTPTSARTGASSTTWSATGQASGGCRWAAWAP